MDIDREEIAEMLEHHQAMLRTLRRRLWARERQEAEYGINVPPEVSNEILTLNERIGKHEAEIVRLRTLAAEDQRSLAEVEYWAALAEAWEPGRPTVAGAARLQLLRLRLGITPPQAEQLEREVRAALAEEVIQGMGKRFFRVSSGTYHCTIDSVEYTVEMQTLAALVYGFDSLTGSMWEDSVKSEQLEPLGRAIRLDLQKTVDVLVKKIPAELPKISRVRMEVANTSEIYEESDNLEDLPEQVRPGRIAQQVYSDRLRQWLSYDINVSEDDEEWALFERFFAALDAILLNCRHH